MNTVEALTGVKPIIYTGASYITPHLTDPSITVYDLWDAEYPNTVIMPAPITPWTQWTFWQYGQALVKGIHGGTKVTDLDMLNGGPLELSEFGFKDKFGIYRPSSGIWGLDQNGDGVWNGVSGGDASACMGNPGDIPISGDWNGDGKDKIGLFRNYLWGDMWLLDYNGDRAWEGTSGGDQYAIFGSTGDVPVVGDWNGNGKDEIGVYRTVLVGGVYPGLQRRRSL